MTNPIGTPEERELIEPSAYLKHWTDDDGNYRCRVDLTEICEPWLDALNPTITPLYAATALQSRIEEVAMLREAVTPSADTKAAYMGEFSFTIDEVSGDCGSEVARRIYVPWTTIKEIMAAIRERATPTQPGDQ